MSSVTELPLQDEHDLPQTPPDLVQKLNHTNSVLTLTVSPELECIFAGTQDGEIVVWSLVSFQRMFKVQAHKRSVLSLILSADGTKLFSSAAGPVVNVWEPKTMKRLYEIYSTQDIGDIFSIAYSAKLDTVYIGAQNTSLQWVSLNDEKARVSHNSDNHPYRRTHAFFDSKAVGGASTPRHEGERLDLVPQPEATLEINPLNYIQYAQFGCVYCSLILKEPTVQVGADEEVLITGGGEGTIKVWRLRGPGPLDKTGDAYHPEKYVKELAVLGEEDFLSVMAIAIDGSFLYAGKRRGVVELWDLDTLQRLRVIKAHVPEDHIMALNMEWGCLWSSSTGGISAVRLGPALLYG